MSEEIFKEWEPVIGLEIHAQLNTKTKIFSSAPNRFGDEPNLNISATCTAQPGALPVLNRSVVQKAVQFGLAVGATISKLSTFDRKSYFYPDSPRGFQITQFEKPLLRGGEIQVNGRKFQINRAHIEDDAGMLKHFSSFAGVDFNRAGAPLIEIVSEPCMHSKEDASLYASAVRTLLLYIDACDGNMEEGSFRMDANISVRKKGEETLRPRVEIKNMNSFSFMEMAIASEVERQIGLYIAHPDRDHLELIPPGTYKWDPETKQAILMRQKESSDDYRYFPEPDLAPLLLTDEYIDQLRSKLPELPHERYRRYVSELGLSEYSAQVLIQEKALSDYFEKALVVCKSPKLLCNWITVEFSGKLKDTGKTLLSHGLLPEHVAKLVLMIDKGTITAKIAKSVADEMMRYPGLDPEEIVKNNSDYQPLMDTAEIEKLVDQVLEENPQSIQDFLSGRDRALAFLVGSVMKLTRNKASPQIVNELLKKKIEERKNLSS